jgi:2-polyprenyl-6-hydroxyphenyl methylase/3-demethylubiquinone-9 3-methyltransferase
MRKAFRGELPERYCAPPTDLWRFWFDHYARASIEPGMSVLDLGAGRKPSIPPELRPPGVRWVGFDIDPQEMARAPEGSYDETLVGDACAYDDRLAERFDLVLSLFLLEHVPSVPAALENARRYLRPGGRLVAQLAGGRSVHALVNRAIPQSLGRKVAHRAMRSSSYRAADSVFPAIYDSCTESDLKEALREWGESQIIPQHTGAQYFLWANWATGLYIGLEEAVSRRGWDDLATWYLVVAAKSDGPDSSAAPRS